MSDETATTQEIPSEEDDARSPSTGIDREGDPRMTPPIGAALSVLWWVEGGPIPPR
jgi:hypothetical protein